MDRLLHNSERDVCVVGAGHIGLPWAAALANKGYRITCVDINENRVDDINNGSCIFDEPRLEEYLQNAIRTDRLKATTEPETVSSANIVAFTLNAPQDELDDYLSTIKTYNSYISAHQIIVNRTTLPVPLVRSTIRKIVDGMDISESDLHYVTFPERLAEGKAIEEIENLPKIVGSSTPTARKAISKLLSEFSGDINYTDPETAMLVKLIDNSYRDARFAIANQFAIIADELGLDAHEAVELANKDYPRNDIPSPGTVGGKCLIKDPHFLTDQHLPFNESTPNLFRKTREVNRAFEKRIANQVSDFEPKKVAILGTSYKKGIGDETESPSLHIKDIISSQGIATDCYDPYVPGRDNLEETIEGADVVLIAVNHLEFEKNEEKIKTLASGPIIDVWGIFQLTSEIFRPGKAALQQVPTRKTD